MFDEKKAAHVAAFFISRAGGRINILKLMKLMYLAERKSFELYAEPMIGDSLVSMEHGPVLSATLNCANGYFKSAPDGWPAIVDARENYELALKFGIADPTSDLLELSDVDVEILDRLWGELGHMDQWELRDYTHHHCPEWRDPKGSSEPIDVANLLAVLGYHADEIDDIEARIAGVNNFRRALRRVA